MNLLSSEHVLKSLFCYERGPIQIERVSSNFLGSKVLQRE